ncbi:hypothetical protein [Streptomyces vilmorinianum]|uniref:hypothetical protein n=1 Tax=Streptomyces vilmorinianum TaxID=3051092 RepID=UPI0010FB2198|nr:hypothetical protein [Streptomyces vilmorinianum]
MVATQSAGDTPRGALWPGIAGIGSAAFLVTGLMLEFQVPDVSGKDGVLKAVTHYAQQSNQDLAEASAWVTLVGGMLFLWFLVALARLAGNRSHLILVGGTVFAVFIMVSALAANMYAITASRSDAFLVIPQTAMISILLLDVAYGALLGAMLGAAVLLFALWRVALTTGELPAWLGWVGFVVAVATLGGPFTAWVTPVAFALWILLTSVLLILKSRSGHVDSAT